MLQPFPFSAICMAVIILFTSFSPYSREECYNAIASNMRLVKGGKFKMGSGSGNADEMPVHEVKLNSFYIGLYEISQEQWEAVMGKNPSYFKACPSCPVDNISWVDATKFITRLNDATGQHYRLPTEAEWEFAARGGVETNNNVFSGSNSIDDVAWSTNNSQKQTHPVGLKMPNELGIWDMTGNVAEWCSDFYDEKYYALSPVENPQGPKDGNWHVLRGGSWFCNDIESRNTSRTYPYADYRLYTVGLRLAKDK